MAFQKVKRMLAFIRMALQGPSGAGKTVGALLLAYGITGDWSKIALIDTEHGRAQFYGNRTDLGIGEFLYQELVPPYTVDRCIALVKEAEQAVGPEGVIILDSMSHMWEGEGGVLNYKELIEQQPGKNSFTAWNDAGKMQNHLISTLLSVNCHVICTLRTKMAYAMEQNDRGRTVPVKIGLAPVQRENTEYEFDVVFNVARNHMASLSKDTTFLDNWTGMITPELGSSLKNWLSGGAEPHKCEDCGTVIMSSCGRTADEIANGTAKNYGRKLCWACMSAEIKKQKELKEQSNAETVSE